MEFHHKKNGLGVFLVILIFTTLILFSAFTSNKRIIVEKVKIVTPIIKYDTIDIKRATRYNAEPRQCDSSPFETADGSKIVNSLVKQGKQRWVALSRDLIKDNYRNKNYPSTGHWKGNIKFGDTILVESKKHPFLNGLWVVHDCMNKRYKESMDFLTVKGQKPVLGVGRDIKIIVKQ